MDDVTAQVLVRFAEAEQIADGLVAGVAERVQVMYGGRLFETGDTDTIYYHSKNPYTRGLMTSIPSATARTQHRLTPIPGAPPSALHFPEGCVFRPRCRHATDKCREEPALERVDFDGKHLSRCHYATSLPELVTVLVAVRLRAFDLAAGNLFGSNAFNMGILFIADLAYQKGPLLAAVKDTHAVTAFVSILLMSVGIMGIIYRAEKRFLFIEPDSALMIAGYLIGMGLIYRLG